MYEFNHLQLTEEETKELVRDFTTGILSCDDSLFNRNEIQTVAKEIEDYLMNNFTKKSK